MILNVSIFLNIVFLSLFAIVSVYVYRKSNSLKEINSGDLFKSPGFMVLNYDKHYCLFVIIGFLIAFVVRIFDFGLVPGYFNQDGALAAIDAKSLLDYGVDHTGMSWPVHLTGWDFGQMSSLMTYLQIISIKFFGMTVLGVRLPSFIISYLGIVCLFVLAKKLFNKYFGLLVLYFIAINPWHIMQSRWALEANLYPHLIIIGLCLLCLALEIKNVSMKSKITRYGYLMASMIVFGLSMYAYGISIYTTPILLIFISISLLCNCDINKYEFLFCILIYFFVAGFFILTMTINCFKWETIQIGAFTLPYFENSKRGSDVLFFSNNVFENLILNIVSIFLVTVFQYDMLDHNFIISFGTVYLFTFPFIVIGFIYMISKFRKHIGFIFISGLCLATVTCGVLTSLVNINRLNIAHYTSVLLACVGIYVVVYVLKRKFLNIALISAYVLMFSMFVIIYFTDYVSMIDNAFHKSVADPIMYLDTLNDDIRYKDYDFYITISQNEDDPYKDFITVNEVYAMFYHDLDSEYIRNIVPDDSGKYYKEKYNYFYVGTLTKDDIKQGIYMVYDYDIDLFYELDCYSEIIFFDDVYIVIVE